MSSTDKKTSKIDPEQRQLIENAQKRIKQKKRLTAHFVVFLAGSILFIILNLVLKFGENFRPLNTDWFVWAILAWFFFLLIHFINVFIVNSFMGKDWEEKQLEKLVEKQQLKIEQLQLKVEKEHPLPNPTPTKRIQDDSNFSNPDHPIINS
ncbi:2TM domain-containing protein [Mesonia sp. MT50]|uniref:2TM domain-containing protein n=1 Tax=Mesonia profundi TaxID=3070998 RepID=A0ABU1A3C1_9FLAO|nr:2TM domain-containing protein [Mesonia profundi]MDQ7918119.1 2TM domain-containing protein [Mesonia profundi]